MNKNNRILWIICILLPLMGIAYIIIKKQCHQSTVQTAPSHDESMAISPELVEEEDENLEYPASVGHIEHQDQTQPNKILNPAKSDKKAQQNSIQSMDKESGKPSNIKKETGHHKNKKSDKQKKHEKKQAPAKAPAPSEAAAQETPTPESDKTQTLNITDSLTKKKLGYHHWTGWYYPSKWVLKFDNTEIMTFDGNDFDRLKNTIKIVPNKPVKVHFDYEFLGGRRYGWREVVYQFDCKTTAINLDFDWKSEGDYQILVTPAKVLSTDYYRNK